VKLTRRRDGGTRRESAISVKDLTAVTPSAELGVHNL
jgi:hypothetical protein